MIGRHVRVGLRAEPTGFADTATFARRLGGLPKEEDDQGEFDLVIKLNQAGLGPLEIPCKKGETIADVKGRYEKIYGCPPAKQSMRCRGEEVGDDEAVEALVGKGEDTPEIWVFDARSPQERSRAKGQTQAGREYRVVAENTEIEESKRKGFGDGAGSLFLALGAIGVVALDFYQKYKEGGAL